MNAPAPAPAPIPQAAGFSCPGRPRPLARRLAIHNRVLRQIRDFLDGNGFNEVPVSALAPVNTACEAVDPSFVVDHCGHLAFARQSAQLDLDGMIAQGFPSVWCESESLRREWKADERHLTGFKLIEAEQKEMIMSIFEFRDTDVQDIMTPRTDVVMIQKDTSIMEAVCARTSGEY